MVRQYGWSGDNSSFFFSREGCVAVRRKQTSRLHVLSGSFSFQKSVLTLPPPPCMFWTIRQQLCVLWWPCLRAGKTPVPLPPGIDGSQPRIRAKMLDRLRFRRITSNVSDPLLPVVLASSQQRKNKKKTQSKGGEGPARNQHSVKRPTDLSDKFEPTHCHFVSATFRSLAMRQVFVAQNRVRAIEGFEGLTRLRKLDLGANRIRRVLKSAYDTPS